MKKMMITWAFLAIGLFGTIYLIGLNHSKSFSSYHELEADLVESAHIYLEIEDISLEINETLRLTSKKMIENKTLTELNVKGDECEGYVIIKKTFKGYDYTPYIKCSKYSTVDYE